MFDFQCIYVAKLGCRPSLKSFLTFIMTRDDMNLSQKQAIIADSESAKHTCKSHTVSAENSLYLLVSNTCLVTDNNSVEI